MAHKEYWEKYRKYDNEWLKKSIQDLKIEVFARYSNNDIKCSKCGFTDLRALSIDHINGGGCIHRKSIKPCSMGSSMFYRWLKKNDFPEGCQILCMNCQFIKRSENNEHRRNY